MIPASQAWAILPARLEALSRLDARELTTLAETGRLRSTAPAYELRDGVAILGLSGVMVKPEGILDEVLVALFGGTSTPALTEAVRQAAADPVVRAIVLRVDSPGGEVAGVAELARTVREAAGRKLVVAAVEDLTASGALWAISGSNRIVATSPTSEIGSIGAYAVVEDFSEMARALGIKVHVVSSAPPLKGAGVEGTEITSPQLTEWQRRIDDLAAVMVADVAMGRGVSVAKVQGWATGAVWIAEQARQLGLVDQVGTFEQALAHARGATRGGRMVKAEILDRNRTGATHSETAAFQEAEVRARAMVAAGRAPSVSAALNEVWREDPALYKAHYQERTASPFKDRSERVQVQHAARAEANRIYDGVVALAEAKVAAGKAPNLHEAINIAWKETGLYPAYMAARPR